MRFKFHQDKVALKEPVKTVKEANSQLRYIRRYNTRPLWHNLSIAKRSEGFVVVGKLKQIKKVSNRNAVRRLKNIVKK